MDSVLLDLLVFLEGLGFLGDFFCLGFGLIVCWFLIFFDGGFCFFIFFGGGFWGFCDFWFLVDCLVDNLVDFCSRFVDFLSLLIIMVFFIDFSCGI